MFNYVLIPSSEADNFSALQMLASFHGREIKRNRSHTCGLWMLIAAAFRCAKGGAVERLE